MTAIPQFVIPAKAGIHSSVPACIFWLFLTHTATHPA